MGCQCERGRLHQTLDSSLGRGVVRLLNSPKESRDTGYGDDRPTPMLSLLLGHLIGDSPCDEEGAVEVDLLCLDEEIIWHVQEGMERANPCVRDQYIDSTVCSYSFLDDL